MAEKKGGLGAHKILKTLKIEKEPVAQEGEESQKRSTLKDSRQKTSTTNKNAWERKNTDQEEGLM